MTVVYGYPMTHKNDKTGAVHNIGSQHLHDVAVLLSSVPPYEVLRAAEVIDKARDNGRIVFVVGNGGSAATATHFATDLSKNLEIAVRAMSFDSVPSLTAWSNDIHFETALVEQVMVWAEAGDVVVLISHSGNSANVLNLAERTKQWRLHTIGLCGNRDGLLSTAVDTLILTPHELPEVVEDVHAAVCHAIIRLLKGMDG